jgi:hypothetical protein
VTTEDAKGGGVGQGDAHQDLVERVDRSWPGPRTSGPDDLHHAIAAALNRFSAENNSNTPDFLLAHFLLGCLAAFDSVVPQRETWYGRDNVGPTGQPREGKALNDALNELRQIDMVLGNRSVFDGLTRVEKIALMSRVIAENRLVLNARTP